MHVSRVMVPVEARGVGALELELQEVVSPLLWVLGNQIQVL